MVLGAGQDTSADSYSFTTVDVPGATNTNATGINNRGQIVGFYHDASGDHGFVLSSDRRTFTTIDNPAGIGVTSLQGINDDGYVIGVFTNPITNFTQSFLADVSGSAFVNFGDPSVSAGSYGTYAHGINDRGQIVGHFFGGGSDLHGFLRNADGTFVNFDDPNAPVGTIGTLGTVGRGINDIGQIVGYFPGLNGTGDFAFLRSSDGSAYTDVTVPNSQDTVAAGINNRGEIVGYFDTASAGFVRSSKGIFTFFHDPDATEGIYPQGINDRGQIVGYFVNASGYHGFVATPTTP